MISRSPFVDAFFDCQRCTQKQPRTQRPATHARILERGGHRGCAALSGSRRTVRTSSLFSTQESLRGKHHLLSTGSCGGVFRARYWQFRSAGTAVENKLRGGENRGWATGIGRPGAPPPPQAKETLPRYRASIRATEPYNAERERRRIEQAVDRRLARGRAAGLLPLAPLFFCPRSGPLESSINEQLSRR